jgi:hypothetical protein
VSRPEGLIELPNGECIFYDDANHSYWRARRVSKVEIPENGYGSREEAENDLVRQAEKVANTEWKRSTRLTGASTLCKPYSYDSGRLLAWKERVTCEGIAELVTSTSPHLGWLASGERIKEQLILAERDADSVRDRKGDVGTRAHSVLEALAAGHEPQIEDGYGAAVVKWWEARRPTVLNCEQFVYSATHGFAGRFDLRANFIRVPGHVELIDLKTSGWLAPSMHVQLALYELAAKECGVGHSDRQTILQVKDDGTWREVSCRATEADALAAIAVYRGAGRIERESGLPKAKAA